MDITTVLAVNRRDGKSLLSVANVNKAINVELVRGNKSLSIHWMVTLSLRIFHLLMPVVCCMTYRQSALKPASVMKTSTTTQFRQDYWVWASLIFLYPAGGTAISTADQPM